MNLRDELMKIRANVGELTPKRVVEAAADPGHPLHDRFEWDDTVAGQRWREEQASCLIRCVKEPAPEGQEQTLRSFVSVRGRDTRSGDYVPTAEAFADPLTRKIVLRDMEREWKALRTRYEHMVEFAELVGRDLGLTG